MSESSIIAGETTHLWWHSCLGRDTSVPTVTPTSAAGLVLTGSSVALWNTTASALLPAANGLRHKIQDQRAGSDILGGNEFEIQVDFIPASSFTYMEEKRMASWKNLKFKLFHIGLIF